MKTQFGFNWADKTMARLTYLKKLAKMHKSHDRIISANQPLRNYASCFS